MEVRELTEKDLEGFREVFSKVVDTSFPEYPPRVRDFFKGEDFESSYLEKRVKDWDYEVLLAIDESRIVGFLVMEKMHGGVSFCNWLTVVEEDQRRGVGTLLMKNWEEKIRQKGGHKLMLISHDQGNKEFYRKCGFKEEGFEEKLWYGIDYWVYGKVIGEPKQEGFLKS